MILLSPDAGLIERVAASATKLLAGMPRAPIIAASLSRRGALIRTRDLAEACAIANRIAPEHLELAVADPNALLPLVKHAGAIFAGFYAGVLVWLLAQRSRLAAAGNDTPATAGGLVAALALIAAALWLERACRVPRRPDEEEEPE